MSKPQNLQAALAYARLGWPVFPLRPRSKRPATPNGFKDASTDEEQIAKWWEALPDAGVAIATGREAGLFVIDIDPRHGGDQTLATLEAQHSALPPTVESITGGGGRHLFFTYPPSNPASCKPWTGIDIKSDGGYVVAPYSTHPCGQKYHWREGHDPGDISPIPAPQWLLEELQRAPKGDSSPEAERSIPEGTRNEALLSLAGTMQRRGMSMTSILRALVEENNERCSPPLPLREVEAIVRSITRYSPNDRESPGVKRPPQQFHLADVLTMTREAPPPIDWLLTDRIALGDISLIVGEPGCGKSWVTLDLAITQALGLPTMGHFHTDPRRVLLVDEENPADEVWRRLRHILAAWEVSPEGLSERLFISKPCQGFSFREPSFVKAIQRQIDELQPEIIIFDSLTAIADIRDESKAPEVRRFYHDRLYPLRALNNATIICVHHTSKAVYQIERTVRAQAFARGSIDFLAGCDSALLLENAPAAHGPGTLKLSPLKVRRGEMPSDILLRLVKGTSGGVRPLLHSITGNGSPRGGPERASQPMQAQAAILARLRASPSPLPRIAFDDLEEDFPRDTISAAILSLKRARRVFQLGTGQHRTYRLWQPGDHSADSY